MRKIYILLLVLLFINTLNINAQSPAGVSAGTTNQIWLDANQLTLSNGTPVSSWTDMSGNGNNAGSITTNSRPTFTTNHINGMPSLVFDGTSDVLRIPAVAALNTGNISQFIVFDGSQNTSTGVMFAGKYQSHNQFLMSYATNSTLRSWVIRLPNTTKGAQTTKNASYQILDNIWSSTTGNVNLFKNGTSFGTATGATSVPSNNTYFSIGANPGSNSYKFRGGIAEIIAYSSTLNSAERIIVENYLGAKYGIAIANDFFAYEASHQHDLVGIGQEADGSNTDAASISTFQMNNMTTPSNGDYVMVAHDGVSLNSINSTDIPSAGWARYERTWRAGVTGTPGTVDITFDISQFSVGAPNSYVLLIDGDGVFATGATQYLGVYNALNETVSFSNVILADGDFIGLANTAANIISTGVTTDWHTTTTWNCACIPTINSPVTILTGHTVNVNGQNAFASDLTIDGTLTFSSSDTLTLSKNLVNNGTVTPGSSTFKFESTLAAQTIDGNFAFQNLVVDNSFGVTYSSGTSTILGWLDVESGSFSTNNSITLLSNASGSGMIRNPSTGSIIGDLTVERFLNEGESWYLLASPLTNADIEDWNQEFEMQGFTGTEWPSAPFSSFFYYDETATGPTQNEGYQVPNNTTDITTNTVGWQAYVGNDSYGPVPKTIDATGTPRLGDGIVINGTYTTNIGDPSSDGWNLVGNPYQSPVRFVNVAKGGNYDKAFRKKASGAQVAINNLDIISPGEGFWLHCLNGPCNLTFDAEDVVDAADVYNLKTSNISNDLLIKLIYNNSEEDEIKIGFDPQATSNYDISLDAYKLNNLFNFKPNISLLDSQNKDLYMGYYSDNFNGVLPLRIYTENPSGNQTNYTLKFNNVKQVLEKNKHLVLEDRLSNTFVEINEGDSMSFMMYDTVKTPRFFLHISSPLNVVKSDVSCYNQNDGQITVSGFGSGPFDYILYDEFMNVISSQSNVAGSATFNSITSGTYKIQVNNNGNYGTLMDQILINEPMPIDLDFAMDVPSQILNGYSEYSLDTFEVEVNQLIEFTNNSTGALSYSWDFGDLTSSNQVSPSHMYFSPGLYKVGLTGEINSSCQNIIEQYIKVNSVTSVKENNLLDDLIVYNQDRNIFIMFNNSFKNNYKVSVYNTIGQEVFNSIVKADVNHTEKISLIEAKGVYLVTIFDGERTKTEKIVITNE